MKPYILGIDPSGSFKEGKGTTGIAMLNPEGQLIRHTTIEAKDHAIQPDYWNAVLIYIKNIWHEYQQDLVLSVEDYVLYATSAKAQINSEMETSKLIGAITMLAYAAHIPVYMRNASQVMNRWANDILVHKGLIFKKGNRYVDANGKYINPHSLDALRHAVHCYYFDLTKGRK